jgi:NTE family protein
MDNSSKKIGLVLQGGGALGAYETGAIQRLYEEGYRPDIITGTSIGAFNAAVLAAPMHGEPHECLREMWEYLCHEPPFPLFQQQNILYTSLGHPRFFKLNHSMFGLNQKPSIYDISPALDTMQRFIDFDRLNSADAPNVVITATNVVSGEIERFSNRTHELRPEHIMASGALPPSFPPIEIDGEFYWDGGIYDNTPIQSLIRVLDEHEIEHMPIFVVELFGALGDTPKNLSESIDRMTELVYEDKFWKTFEGHDAAYDYSAMLWDLDDQLAKDAPIRQSPQFQQLMKLRAVSHIFTIPAERAALRNVIDFSPQTIRSRIESGYRASALCLEQNEFRINYVLHMNSAGRMTEPKEAVTSLQKLAGAAVRARKAS